ncbi:hypothetical protein LTR37_013837 [Vermiconidia calcicola]|uniref:Uncharacterized protein n=1 Tax=Vermiconidia calcicola TaxID=1690605 RepID=A0ACC3MV72_9PEZI|nr:hypothetical protein LTR37_013837 [Vermiconidia calcicola]
MLAKDLAKFSRNQFTISIPAYVSLSRTTSTSELQAISRVLNTAELFEAILIMLPVLDLRLRVPLTCKAFRNAFYASPTIRQYVWQSPVYLSSLHAFPFAIHGNRIHAGYKPDYELRSNLQGLEYIVLNIPLARIRQAMKASTSLQKSFLVQPPVNHFIAIKYGSSDYLLGRSLSGLRHIDWHEEGGIMFRHVLQFLQDAEEDGYSPEHFYPYLTLNKYAVVTLKLIPRELLWRLYEWWVVLERYHLKDLFSVLPVQYACRMHSC